MKKSAIFFLLLLLPFLLFSSGCADDSAFDEELIEEVEIMARAVEIMMEVRDTIAVELISGISEEMESWGQENIPYVVTQVELQDERDSNGERTGELVFVVQVDDPLLLPNAFNQEDFSYLYLVGPVEMMVAGIRHDPDKILGVVSRIFLSIRDSQQTVAEFTPDVMRLVVEGKISVMDALESSSTLLTRLTE